MNAYELADEIEDWATAANCTISIKAGQMLRAQAKRIEELEKEKDGCGNCHACLVEVMENGFPKIAQRMILCPDCGNKRCPKASNHRYKCTGSNEVGQLGSVYTHPNKELSDEQIRAAFNQWLMLDEGVVRFDYQLKHEWVAEQWERWQQAFKLARGEE